MQKWVPFKNVVQNNSPMPDVRKVSLQGLEHSTSYYFIVRSRNQFGLSPPSPPSDLIKTQSTCPPALYTALYFQTVFVLATMRTRTSCEHCPRYELKSRL